MNRRTLICLPVFFVLFLQGCGLTNVDFGSNDPGYEKVACVGNSITQGFNLPDEQTYPVVLRGLVGSPHQVTNFGVAGSTVLKKGDNPVWKVTKYGYALEWKPTIVVIELGTNDSKPRNWQYKNEFKQDYKDLINTFRQLPTSPDVYICIPPPLFKEGYEFKADLLHNEIVPMVYEVAEENKVPIIDLYKLMANRDSLFIDGIHPNAKGAAFIAEEIRRVIKIE